MPVKEEEEEDLSNTKQSGKHDSAAIGDVFMEISGVCQCERRNENFRELEKCLI